MAKWLQARVYQARAKPACGGDICMLIKIIMKVIVLMIFHRYNIIYMHVYACMPGFLLINFVLYIQLQVPDVG